MAMPVALLSATRVVSFVKNYFLEYDAHDDEKPPYLGFFLKMTCLGAGLSAVVYLCARLVASTAFPQAASVEHQVFMACFAVSAAICLFNYMSAVIYLKLLFWRDEHDRSTSGTSLSFSAQFIAATLSVIAGAWAVIVFAHL